MMWLTAEKNCVHEIVWMCVVVRRCLTNRADTDSLAIPAMQSNHHGREFIMFLVIGYTVSIEKKLYIKGI